MDSNAISLLFSFKEKTRIAPLTVRAATPQDTETIIGFILELVRYEKAEAHVTVSKADIESSLFSENASTKALNCCKDASPIGYAAYFFNYSTWLGKNGLYLEDMYISPAHRQAGAGNCLLNHLPKLAVEKGCGRFEWSVLDWNEPAIQFYEKIGANPQKGWVIYRLAGEDLTAFDHSMSA